MKTAKQVENYLNGNYSSFFLGQGLDFKEIREYSTNDDLRNIDWNVTARIGKLHVRVYDEEKENKVWLILDMSPSMDFGSGLITKKDIMIKFAALIGYLSFKRGDKTGAIIFDRKIEKIIPPEKGLKQIYIIIKSLLDYESRPGELLVPDFSSLCSMIGKRRTIFFMSDFIFPDFSWSNALGEVKIKNDLALIQIFDPVEEKLPSVGYIYLSDPESGKKILIDTSSKYVQENYQKQVIVEKEKLKNIFSSLKIEPVKIYTSSDIAEVFIHYTEKLKNRR
jgi:uncharacterized protein (DUF58 family)